MYNLKDVPKENNFITSREKYRKRLQKSFQTAFLNALNFRDCFKPVNKVKSYFLGDSVLLKITLTENIMRNKFITAISNSLK